MKAFRLLVIRLTVVILGTSFCALAEDSGWQRIDLYYKGFAAYQKSDWHTAAENLTAFKEINEGRFEATTTKADVDFKSRLGDAIENCFYNLTSGQSSVESTQNEADTAGGGSNSPAKRSTKPDVELPANPP